MTKEHDDKRVTAAYRDVATERTPAALDEKVLAMAAAEARTRYGLTRAWIRPVAWAATIGLSLAFVLELSRYGDVADELPRTEPAAVEPADDLTEREPPARARAPAAAPAGSDAEAKSMDAARPETNLPKRSDTMPMVRQAEEQARMQAGEARSATVLADQPVAGFAAAKREAMACDADDRASATTWFACVEALREAGLEEMASQELDALREAFPEFRPPGAE